MSWGMSVSRGHGACDGSRFGREDGTNHGAGREVGGGGRIALDHDPAARDERVEAAAAEAILALVDRDDALSQVRAAEVRERLSPEKLAGLQKAPSQSFETIWMGLAGLYCTFEAIRALISEVDTWWLWLLAAAAQFAALLGRRHADVKLGAVKVQPDVETQRRRRTLWFAVPAVACLYAAQPVAESAARLNNGFVGAASIVLVVAGLAGFAAAGWAAVWVFKERMPDTESTRRPTPKRHQGHTPAITHPRTLIGISALGTRTQRQIRMFAALHPESRNQQSDVSNNNVTAPSPRLLRWPVTRCWTRVARAASNSARVTSTAGVP